MRAIFLSAGISLLLAACGSGGTDEKPVVVSLLGKSYYEPERTKQVQARLDTNLRIAHTNWESNPNEENYIWYGRRLGYLSHFQEAVDVFTLGI